MRGLFWHPVSESIQDRLWWVVENVLVVAAGGRPSKNVWTVFEGVKEPCEQAVFAPLAYTVLDAVHKQWWENQRGSR